MSTDSQAELLRYYERELSYLRKMGALFSERYPKIAARLELAPQESPDPHVERLIESFAFLTGRLQRDIENEFPEITQALLEILYPQLVNPVPPMAIAQFDVASAEGKFTTGHVIPAGTPLVAEAEQGQECQFRTGAPITLWPVQVTRARYESPGRYPFLSGSSKTATVLRLVLENVTQSADPETKTKICDLEMDHLRLFLTNQSSQISHLVDMMLTQAHNVVLLPDGDVTQPVYLGRNAIQQAGFADDEALLPYPPHTHKGYRLLQEYFTFPQKFQFFDVLHLDRIHTLEAAKNMEKLEILILLDSPAGLPVSRDNFLTGCAPIINIFRKVSDPIHLDHRKHRYTLHGDATRKRTTEIHSILKVTGSPRFQDDSHVVSPFFSYHHHGERENAYWFATRRQSLHQDMPGTDMRISFVDLDYQGSLPDQKIVYAHTLCTNRRLADLVPVNAKLQIDAASPLATVKLLTKPTPNLMPHLGSQTYWKLISNLSLNYLSLTEGASSLHALKEILGVYTSNHDPSQAKQIRGITNISCRPKVHHIGKDAWRGFCHGLEVTLEFDEDFYAGASPLLLASVLNRFFALYTSLNSFTQTIATRKNRKGIWRIWPPMAGEKTLL